MLENCVTAVLEGVSTQGDTNNELAMYVTLNCSRSMVCACVCVSE